MKLPLIFLLTFLTFLGLAQNTTPKSFRLSPELNEVSGLYLDQQTHTFWWINDSGNSPTLFQTNAHGHILQKINLSQIQNIDWEDLTTDSEGNIFIGDFGNNRNQRRDLRIFKFNPTSRQLDSILFQYPDQEHFPPRLEDQNFDMEAFFWWNDSLHLFSKNKLEFGNFYTKHYVMSAQSGQQTPILRDSIYLKNRVVTAAAISPDGQTVALLAYNYKKVLGFIPWSTASVFYIRNFSESDFLKGNWTKKRAPYFVVAPQFESLDFWNNETVFSAFEKTFIVKPKAKRSRFPD